jgi:hypothetical protein
MDPRAPRPEPPRQPSVEELAGSILETLPSLTNAQRRAFLGRFSSAQCSAAGAQPDARAVRQQALAWLPLIHRAVVRRPRSIRRYGAARFAWLLERLLDLDETIEARSGAPASADVERCRRAGAERRARAVFEDLATTFAVLAGGDANERLRLEAWDGAPATHEALATSLRASIVLAEDWLEREGEEPRALVASVGLTKADIEAAHAALHALAAAGADATTEGRRAARAGISIECAAGRVLLELEVVARVFEQAREHDGRVPRLAWSPSLRAPVESSPAAA